MIYKVSIVGYSSVIVDGISCPKMAISLALKTVAKSAVPKDLISSDCFDWYSEDRLFATVEPFDTYILEEETVYVSNK